MDLNTAAMTGLKIAGYERPLPIWEQGFQPALPKGNNGYKKVVAET
jgi:hypothetical protein